MCILNIYRLCYQLVGINDYLLKITEHIVPFLYEQ